MRPHSKRGRELVGSRPLVFLEATSGFEPEIKALQASALPLGHVASYEKGRSKPARGNHGAGYGVRTRDLNLGKVARYQLR